MGGYALTHSKGAAAEYRAAAWFLMHGFQIYWPAIQQGAADFVIEKDSRLQRVQVKVAQLKRGKEYGRLKKASGPSRIENVDIVAIVSRDFNSMWVIPANELTAEWCVSLREHHQFSLTEGPE